jgi:hypothetical protein
MKMVLIAILIVLVILFFPIGRFVRLPHTDPYTHATESDVKSFVTIGMDQKAVQDTFGKPFSTQPAPDGGEVWEYDADPHYHSPALHYAGFNVFFKDKKVVFVGIIRSRDN